MMRRGFGNGGEALGGYENERWAQEQQLGEAAINAANEAAEIPIAEQEPVTIDAYEGVDFRDAAAEPEPVEQETGADNVINLAENQRWQEYIAGQQDRYGAPEYSQATVQRLSQEGVMVDPQAQEQQQALEAARIAAEESKAAEQEMLANIEKTKVEKLEEVLGQLVEDRRKVQEEISQILAEANGYEWKLGEAQQKILARDREFLEQVEARITELYPLVDEVKAKDGEGEPGRFEGASEFDLNTPEGRTASAMRRANFEATMQNIKDPELRAKIEAQLVALETADLERAQAANNFMANEEPGSQWTVAEVDPSQPFEFGDDVTMTVNPDYIDEGAIAKEVKQEAKNELHEIEVANGEATLSPEEKKSLGERIAAKLEGNKTVKRFFIRAALLVATVASLLTGVLKDTRVGSSRVEAATEMNLDGDDGAQKVDPDVFNAQMGAQTEAKEQKEGRSIEQIAKIADSEGGVEKLSREELQRYGAFLIDKMIEQAKENANGLRYSTNPDYMNRDGKESPNAFGLNQEGVYQNQEKTYDALMREMINQPDILASISANFPTILRMAGLGDDVAGIKGFNARQQAVDKALDGKNGGDLQAALVGALGSALKTAEFTFYLENGTEKTSYIYLDGDKYKPENASLNLDTKKRNNAKQVYIVITFSDGKQEAADLNMPCGFQPNLEIDDTERTPVSVKVVFEDDLVDLPPGEQEQEIVSWTWPTPSSSPRPSNSPEPTGSPEPTNSPEPTGTPEASATPTVAPSETPSAVPTSSPAATVTPGVGGTPSAAPSEAPSAAPSESPSTAPTVAPSAAPTWTPGVKPTEPPKATEKPVESEKPAESEKPTEPPKATEKPTEPPKETEKPVESEKPTEPPKETEKPKEPLATKNPEAFEDMMDKTENDREGDVEKTEDVKDTVAKNEEKDDLPEDGNSTVVDQDRTPPDNEEDEKKQEEAEERRDDTSDLTKDEAQDKADKILADLAAKKEAERVAAMSDEDFADMIDDELS